MKHRTLIWAVGLCWILTTGCETASVDCPSGYCGTAVALLPAATRSLFPPTIQGASDEVISDMIFLQLAEIGPDLNTTDPSTFEPSLAESWSIEDSLTIVFRLNANARWHDGEPVTAADVAFTHSIYADPVVNSSDRPNVSTIESVTPRDERTVAFRFTHPYVEQFYDATYHMRVLPKHLLDSIAPKDLATHAFTTHPVGSGPYRLVRWDPGQTIELRADTSFFLGRPGIPRVIWRVIGDPGAIVSPLVADEADLIDYVPGRENVDRVKGANHMRLIEYDAPFYGFLAFNFRDPEDSSRPHRLFSDKQVRQALAMALNRAQVVTTAMGETGKLVSAPATPITPVYSDSISQLPFDTVAARTMLAAAGWTDTDGDGVLDRYGERFGFTLMTPTTSQSRRRSAVVIQAQLRRLGVDVTIAELEWGVHSERLESGNFDAYMGSWGIQPSPRGIQSLWSSVGIGNQNFGSYGSAIVDDLVERGMAARDPETQRQAWQRAFAAMNDDVPAIWLYIPVMNAAIHDRFENVSIRPDNWAATLWQWRVTPGRWLPRDLAGST